MVFEFSSIEKSRHIGDYMPDDVIRISPKSGLSFGYTVTSKLGVIHTNKDDSKFVNVQVDYDARNQALRLTSSPMGFKAMVSENLRGSFRTPLGLVRAGIITGDYKLVEGENNIYKLV